MFKIIKETIEWGGSTLTLETGKIARQADGAVIVTHGETVVMCTVVAAKTAKEGIDFLPLTVNYREMSFASGRIPGGYLKREGKPSDREVLVSRLIDRPIRPLFPDHFYHEVQVLCTVLSYDGINDPDISAIIGASAALTIAGIPFLGPVAAARVGYENGKYCLNHFVLDSKQEMQLDLVVAGTESSVLMVESEAQELSEEIMLGAVEFGHNAFQPIIKMIKEFSEKVGKAVWWQEPETHNYLFDNITNFAKTEISEAYSILEKSARSAKLNEIKDKIIAEFVSEQVDASKVKFYTKKLEQEIVRSKTLEGKRIDGRKADDIRKIECEVGVLPRTHGSALFTRGETQALVVTTLGTSFDEQMVDSLIGESKQHFLMHYNFPPYSVGEALPLKPPGRREIGHGKLAWRSLNPLIPSKEDFPYTIRVVSEITESNGSSSMATVCGASMSMMDAGVLLKAPIAGIAMGLIKEGNKEIVLSDIMGDEDHLGDMDFKVAGTEEGITALQMDIKINGISFETMRTALAQAKNGRIHILSKMAEAIQNSRKEVNKLAPVVMTIKIHQDKIRDVIGTGGKVIRALCEETGSKIEIDDTGLVKIAAPTSEVADKTIARIQEITSDVEVGKIYSGKVVKIVDFGAFVSIPGNKEGMVHVSELANERVEKVANFISEGAEVKVKVIGLDRGKIKLSMKCVNQETGEDLSSASEGEDNDSESGRSHDRKDSRHKKPSSNPGRHNNRQGKPGSRDFDTKENKEHSSEKRKYFN